MTLRLLARPRRLVAALAVAAALALPAAAGAWSWGYNYIGSGLNTPQVPGWNYWSYSSANKNSGGTIQQIWQTQSGNWCGHDFSGVTTYWSVPSDCGYGGYLYAEWRYFGGATSYLYIETN